jgi:hypothetical protein
MSDTSESEYENDFEEYYNNFVSSLSFDQYIYVDCITPNSSFHILKLVALNKEGLDNIFDDVFTFSVGKMCLFETRHVIQLYDDKIYLHFTTVFLKVHVYLLNMDKYIKENNNKTLLTNLTANTLSNLINGLSMDFRRCYYDGHKFHFNNEVIECLRTKKVNRIIEDEHQKYLTDITRNSGFKYPNEFWKRHTKYLRSQQLHLLEDDNHKSLYVLYYFPADPNPLVFGYVPKLKEIYECLKMKEDYPDKYERPLNRTESILISTLSFVRNHNTTLTSLVKDLCKYCNRILLPIDTLQSV